MFHKVHKVAKAVAAFAAGVGVVVASVASEVAGVTEDGFVSGQEWQLLVFSVVSAVAVFLAPKNAEA